MNVYELNQCIEEALLAWEQGVQEVIDSDTGEIIPIADFVEKLQVGKKTKIKNLALYVKNRRYDLANLKDAKKVLDGRIKALEKKLEGAEEYLTQITEGQKYEDEDFVISYRKSKVVDIVEGTVIPQEFLVPQKPKPNKPELKKAIEAGAVIEGVSLIEKNNMQIK